MSIYTWAAVTLFGSVISCAVRCDLRQPRVSLSDSVRGEVVGVGHTPLSVSLAPTTDAADTQSHIAGSFTVINGLLRKLTAPTDCNRRTLRKLYFDYEPLMALLPLSRVRSVDLRDGFLEFRFEFGSKRSCAVEIPSVRQAVLESSEKHPYRGRFVFVETKRRTIIVHPHVRFELNESGIKAVRDGDLELKVGLLAPNISLHTEMGSKYARDPDGRLLLMTDQLGHPIVRNGSYVPVRATRWLVITVRKHRVEFALDPTDSQ